MHTKRPWWQWVLGGLVALLILGALLGEDDRQTAAETTTVTVTQAAPPPAVETTTTAQPTETISDARQAVDGDRYARAIEIAAALGASQQQAIRRRISNRLGRRALSALRSGDRRRAGSLLRQAGRYPPTQQLTLARARYRAAKDRAAERARARRRAAEQRRQAARDAQAAEEAQAESGSACDPNYSGCVPAYPPDVNCPEVAGPVQVTGSDPHGLDRDSDGVACE